MEVLVRNLTIKIFKYKSSLQIEKGNTFDEKKMLRIKLYGPL